MNFPMECSNGNVISLSPWRNVNVTTEPIHQLAMSTPLACLLLGARGQSTAFLRETDGIGMCYFSTTNKRSRNEAIICLLACITSKSSPTCCHYSYLYNYTELLKKLPEFLLPQV